MYAARCLLFAQLLLIATVRSALPAPIDERTTLVEAIESVRDAGLSIAYSSELVKDWMLVREPPTEADARLALAEALRPYGLTLEAGADDRWLVVRAAQVAAARTTLVAEEEGEDVARQLDHPAPRPLDEIVIVGSQHALFDSPGSEGQFLSGEDIRRMPHMADDTFRALHRLPGVAASDYQAQFNLRGGALDEVRVHLDGFEISEPFHMRTLYRPLSIVDPGIIGSARLLSGGFGAAHGNYMSGVVDIISDQADSDVSELGVSFVNAFARTWGEFDNGKGNYLLSLRRGYLDLLADAVVDDGEELQPRYSDFFGRVAYAVNDNLELSARALLADNDVVFTDPNDGEDFGEESTTYYLWLSADVQLLPGLSGVTTLFTGDVSGTEDGSQLNPPSENIQRYLDQELTLTGLRSDWSLQLSDDNLLKAGLRYRDLDTSMDYRLSSLRRSGFINDGLPVFVGRDLQFSNSGDDAYAYVAWRTRIGRKLTAELGLRWDRQAYLPQGPAEQTSPRVNLRYDLSDQTSLSAAWGEFQQPQAINDLDIADGDLRYYPPQEAEHRVVGVRHRFERGIELQADVYDKRYRRLRPSYENLLDIYEFAPESNFDRLQLQPDRGRAYGAELTLRESGEGRIDWWVSYAWSSAEDRIDGRSVPRSWDQRHAAIASVSLRGEKSSLSGIARYRSGWPRTVLRPDVEFDGAGNLIGIDADLSARNAARFDDYSRVDVRLTRHVKLPRSSLDFYLEVFNLFDAGNQCCTSNHTIAIGPAVNVSPQFDDFLPRFPSFGFVWRFGPGVVH